MTAAVTAVVVSFNVAPLLSRCLESLQAATDHLAEPVEMVVIDNASTDGSASLVRERFPHARVVVNAENRGFGTACNQGLALAGDTVLFLNPDTELAPDALRRLLDRLHAEPRAAIVGPRLVYPDGKEQSSRRHFPGLLTLLLENTPLEWRLPNLPALRRYRYEGVPGREAEQVDWLSGACLLARSAALAAVGGFDPRYFMYFEEVDLARRLAAHGWQVWYEPAARVIHHHSQSADQDLTAKDRNFYSSKYLFVSRYWGEWAGRALRAAAGTLFGAEWLLQRARGHEDLARRYEALTRWHFAGAGAVGRRAEAR